MFLAKLKSVKRVLKHTSEGQNSSSPLPDTDPSGHTVSAQPVLSSATPVAASSTAGCPNKRNPYHQCSEYCEKRWGEKLNAGENSEPELILPPEWTQITDEKIGQPYFCNTQTDAVSWHPPPGSVYENSAASKTPEKVEANENVITLAADATEKSNGYKPRSNSNKKRAGQGKKQRAGKKNFERAGHGGKKKKKKKKLQAWKQSPRAGSIPCRTKKQRLVQSAAGILALLVVLLVTGPHQLCEVVIVLFRRSLYPMLLPICVLAVALGAAVCTWWFLRCKPRYCSESPAPLSIPETNWTLQDSRQGELLTRVSKWDTLADCILEGEYLGLPWNAFIIHWKKQLYLVTALHVFLNRDVKMEKTVQWCERIDAELTLAVQQSKFYWKDKRQPYDSKELGIGSWYINPVSDIAVAPMYMWEYSIEYPEECPRECPKEWIRQTDHMCHQKSIRRCAITASLDSIKTYFNNLQGRTVTLLQWLDGELTRSTGTVTKCRNKRVHAGLDSKCWELTYEARTQKGSSGAPIVVTESRDGDTNESTLPIIIGVHSRGSGSDLKENCGDFLYPFLNDVDWCVVKDTNQVPMNCHRIDIP